MHQLDHSLFETKWREPFSRLVLVYDEVILEILICSFNFTACNTPITHPPTHPPHYLLIAILAPSFSSSFYAPIRPPFGLDPTHATLIYNNEFDILASDCYTSEPSFLQ
jgi:hypothetical protein